MAVAFLLILGLTAGPPLLGSAVGAWRAVPPKLAWMLSSPIYPCVLSFDTPYRTNAHHFWTGIVIVHLLGWAFLMIAGLRVRRAWQDRPAVGRGALWRDFWAGWQFGHGAQRSRSRRRWLELNPIAWLAGRDRLKGIWVWAMLGVVGVLWLVLYLKYGSALLDPTFYFLTVYTVHTVLKFWVASEACRPLAEDRHSGTLELVLSTPLAVDEILAGEVLALKRQFAGPVGLVLCADFVMLLAGMADRVWDSSNDWVVLCLGVMILFIADLYTLAWVGLWLSLNARKGSHPVRGTIARVLVWPWAVFVLGLTFLTLTPWQSFEPGEVGLLATAFGLSLLNDAFFFTWSRTNLREQFRLAATQRFQGAPTSTGAPDNLPSDPAVAPPVLAQ
jgi:hypothetical protein